MIEVSNAVPEFVPETTFVSTFVPEPEPEELSEADQMMEFFKNTNS